MSGFSVFDTESRGRRWLGWLFVAVALAFTLALVLREGAALPELRSDLAGFGWRIRPVWLLAALGAGILNLLLMSRLWVRIFRGLGGGVDPGEGMRVWLTTNLGRYIPGKVWQLSGLALYMRAQSGTGAAALTAAALYQVLVLATGLAVGVHFSLDTAG